MQNIIETIRRIIRREVEKIYTTELGIVSAVFPHAGEDDTDNYQCSVTLKNRKQADGSDFELRKVPVATQHLGLANIPAVGELVLVSFVGGNIQAPIIIGRLYNDEDVPPVNQDKEFLLQYTPEQGGSIKIDTSGVMTLNSQSEEKSLITIQDEEIVISSKNGQVKITIAEGKIELDAGSNPIDLKSSGDVTIQSTGNITIGDATTAQVKVGGRVLANAVGDQDTIMLSQHQHLGNLGAPCPILVPTETLNSIQAKTRNTQVG